MLYDIAKQAGSYHVYGNGSDTPLRSFPTYREAVTYAHSDEFGRECPIWTPMTISVLAVCAMTIAFMLFLGIR